MSKITLDQIQLFKKNNEKFSAITAYDFSSAKLINETDIPIVLVGDSASMMVYGYDTTIPVKVDEMLFVIKAVCRGIDKALVVADMPFMSYQISIEECLKNAGILIKSGGANAVKIEGGKEFIEHISKLVECGIPVMGHIGLMPQSVNKTSGYKVQGKTYESAKKLIDDAMVIQDAGVFSMVLEGVPEELSKIITEKVNIPTIGIGAGKFCDGQIQVFHDVLGLIENFVPKHSKQFAMLADNIKKGLNQYNDEVQKNTFPESKHSSNLDQSVIEQLTKDDSSQNN